MCFSHQQQADEGVCPWEHGRRHERARAVEPLELVGVTERAEMHRSKVKLSGVLHMGFKPDKCKTALRMALARIKLLRNRKEVQVRSPVSAEKTATPPSRLPGLSRAATKSARRHSSITRFYTRTAPPSDAARTAISSPAALPATDAASRSPHVGHVGRAAPAAAERLQHLPPRGVPGPRGGKDVPRERQAEGALRRGQLLPPATPLLPLLSLAAAPRAATLRRRARHRAGRLSPSPATAAPASMPAASRRVCRRAC
uniref:Uncharacterized protein n=1 Tax=Oryza nivara TaxID=4536 RepID=A0A0E0G5C1_ORYNI